MHRIGGVLSECCWISEVEVWEVALSLKGKDNTVEESRNHTGSHELPLVCQGQRKLKLQVYWLNRQLVSSICSTWFWNYPEERKERKKRIYRAPHLETETKSSKKKISNDAGFINTRI